MAKRKTFEEALGRLEEIAEAMEDDKTGLEESVKLYKEGVELARFCAEKLNGVEQQVSQLNESAEGIFTKRAFDLAEE